MSRKDDLINSYGGVNGILSQTPDVKARIRNELLEAARQDAIDANNQADKAARGSLTNDLAGVAGQVGGVVGGSYLGGQIFGGGGSALASGAPATPVLFPTGGVGGAAAGSGAATTGAGAGSTAGGAGAFSGSGALATYGVPAAVAAGTYLAGKSIYDGIQGKEDKSPQGLFGRAQAAFSTMGASEIPRLFGFGHSKNYYEGKNRKNFANALNEKYGPGTIDAEQFRSDPTSFNYDLNSPGKKKELGGAQALSYLLGAGSVGSKGYTDLSARFANDIKGGADVKGLYAKYGLDYNKAMEGLGADTNISAEHKAALQGGLNDAFGTQPSQQSNQGSPGRRPEQRRNLPAKVKKKAKSASDALSNLWK
jgi:hypothetical protein